ncbi:hypothetical protein ANN_03532 [Periplaneta americana]|uniref:Per a allergen n=1 Tax=Periplaneta americana TaxID=6978 RepID=A0ABQ8U0D6_PERAM|nr:hypothetical protein ANN_03532 [Periplaneta americana]
MNLGSSTESYPAFAHIGLRENPEKPQPGNLLRPGIEPGPPGFAASYANRYSTGVDEFCCLAVHFNRKNKSFEVHEEVHCVASEGGGIRRADIVALDKTNSKGFILDPTVRFEMSQTQPSEVNKEKQQIYEPTIPYFREKYQMEGTWEVHGLMIGARGTIPRSTVNTIKTFGIHDIIPKIITSTIKGRKDEEKEQMKTKTQGDQTDYKNEAVEKKKGQGGRNMKKKIEGDQTD